MKTQYTPKLIAALGAAGYRTTIWGSARRTFTHPRKDGTRRLKLWMAHDVFNSTRRQQLKLQAALREQFGSAYSHGYFINPCDNGFSFCVILKD